MTIPTQTIAFINLNQRYDSIEGFDMGHHKSAHNSHGTYFLSLRALTRRPHVIRQVVYKNKEQDRP